MAEEKKAEKETKKSAKAGKDSKKANKKKTKKNPFKSMAAFFKGVNAERKKVVWPTAKETIKNAAIVLLVVLVVGVCIYGVDTVLSLGMKGIKNLADNQTSVSETVDDDTDTSDDIVENNADADSADDTAE